MRKVLSIVLALSLVLGSMGMAFASFDDVSGGKYEESVNTLADLGVIDGYPSGDFRPDNVVTRGEMAKIVVTALDEDASGKSDFSDMAGHWSDGYVAKAVALGIINGYPSGDFRPDNTVTYEEAAKMLVAALGYTVDVLEGAWPTNWTDKADELGILANVPGGADGAVRGDVALMTFQTLELPIGEVVDGEWVEGDDDSMFNRLEGDIVVTSVKAISKTVDEAGTLEFAINGRTTAANLEKVNDAGYTVEFLANETVFNSGNDATSEDGELSGVDADLLEEFDYEVVITDEDGEEVAKSERVTVEVQRYSEVVTEISEVELLVDNVAVKTGKVSKDETEQVSVKVLGKTKDMEADDDAIDVENLVEYSSSKNAIATAADGTGIITLEGAVGKVTITIKGEKVSKTLSFEVVSEERKVDADKSSISVKTIKDGFGADVDFTVVVKDTFGDAVAKLATSDFGLAPTGVFNAVDSFDTLEDPENEGTYTVTVVLSSTEIKNEEVTIEADNVEIGTIKVTTVDNTAEEVKSYEVKPEIVKLDKADPDNDGSDATTIDIIPKDKNGYVISASVVVDIATDPKYVVKSSNKKVAEYVGGELVSKGVGTAKITVYEKVEALEDKLGDFTITVIDTTPVIESASFKNVKTVKAQTELGLENILPKKNIVLKGSGKYEANDIAYDLSGDFVEIKVTGYDVVGKVILTFAAEGIEAGLKMVTIDGNTVLGIEIDKETAFDDAIKDKVELTVVDDEGKIVGEIKISVDFPEA